MLYLLAEWLGFPGPLNLIRYLSFRSGAAIATALVIGLIIGPKFISMMRVRQGKGQPIREDGPQTHLAKRGTPTMGGLMILVSMIVSALLWMDLTNTFVWACLFVTVGFGAIGFMDDYDKVKKRSHQGISGKVRLLLEFIIAGIVVFLIVDRTGTDLSLPFLCERLGFILPVKISESAERSTVGRSLFIGDLELVSRVLDPEDGCCLSHGGI